MFGPIKLAKPTTLYSWAYKTSSTRHSLFMCLYQISKAYIRVYVLEVSNIRLFIQSTDWILNLMRGGNFVFQFINELHTQNTSTVSVRGNFLIIHQGDVYFM